MQELVEEFEDTSCKFWWQVFFGWGKQQVYQIYRQKNRNHFISIMLQRIITGIIVLKNHSFQQNNWQMYITKHIHVPYNHNLIWYLQYIYMNNFAYLVNLTYPYHLRTQTQMLFSLPVSPHGSAWTWDNSWTRFPAVRTLPWSTQSPGPDTPWRCSGKVSPWTPHCPPVPRTSPGRRRPCPPRGHRRHPEWGGTSLPPSPPGCQN